ncbi:MAG TPA: D-glycerate dehydrogenase [Thermoanaerobaculia bacterium]
MKPRVVITAELPSIAAEILGREFEVIQHSAETIRTEDEMITLLSEADGAITLLTDPLTRRVLSSNPNLRVIGNYAVGVNNIDLSAARELGIVVTNTPDVLTDATADLTMALILATTRRLIEGDRMMREKRYIMWQPLLLLGTTIRGKRLGIIGMGRIGKAVAARAQVFEMEVVYHSWTPHPEGREAGAAWVSFRELLRTSDVISVHTPLTDATRHLINADAISFMKREAVIINTARGAVVDEKALADALERGRIRAAGLDVYENEPEVEPRLLAMPNVVLLPHIGSNTIEARREMARLAATDVTRVLRGETPWHAVA